VVGRANDALPLQDTAAGESKNEMLGSARTCWVRARSSFPLRGAASPDTFTREEIKNQEREQLEALAKRMQPDLTTVAQSTQGQQASHVRDARSGVVPTESSRWFSTSYTFMHEREPVVVPLDTEKMPSLVKWHAVTQILHRFCTTSRLRRRQSIRYRALAFASGATWT
jgi:hypothetical protein